MGSFPETYSDPKSLGKCYTTIDCDSEKTGFLARANAARFQPAQVIGPLGYVCTATDEFLTSLKFHFFKFIFLLLITKKENHKQLQ